MLFLSLWGNGFCRDVYNHLPLYLLTSQLGVDAEELFLRDIIFLAYLLDGLASLYLVGRCN